MFVSFWYSNITENFKNCVNPTLIACCSVASHASQNVTHSGRILKKVQKMHWASSSHIQKHAKQQQQSPILPSSVEFHPKNNNNKLQWSSLIWFDLILEEFTFISVEIIRKFKKQNFISMYVLKFDGAVNYSSRNR